MRDKSRYDWQVWSLVGTGNLEDICNENGLEKQTMFIAFKNCRLAYGKYMVTRKDKYESFDIREHAKELL